MAYIKKEPEKQFIAKFDKYKKLNLFTKKRSPISILFCTNDLPDEWLIDVVRYKTKTGLIVENFMILGKQMPNYMEMMKKDEYEENLTKT